MLSVTLIIYYVNIAGDDYSYLSNVECGINDDSVSDVKYKIFNVSND